MDEFAESVQKILAAWKYPGLGRVVFSEDDQDLVISGNRASAMAKAFGRLPARPS